jgi:thiol-disulfide isomerase/thioredoxin
VNAFNLEGIGENMKRLWLILTVLCMVCLAGCRRQYVFDNDLVKTEADMSGYVYLKDPSPVFDLVSIDESYRLFEEEQAGVIFYSRVSCPFCNAAVPVLNDAAKELGVRIMYTDIEDPEFMKLSWQERDEKVFHLMELIDSILKTDDSGEKAFFIPLLIAVKNGKIMDSYVSVSEGVNTENFEETPKENIEHLKELYKRVIKAAMD